MVDWVWSFNPAMLGYAVLLVSFPRATSWLPAVASTPGLTARAIFAEVRNITDGIGASRWPTKSGLSLQHHGRNHGATGLCYFTG
jgi:Na+-translocating ferredoxin:NAD+ oxidoreductase RnfD subunit